MIEGARNEENIMVQQQLEIEWGVMFLEIAITCRERLSNHIDTLLTELIGKVPEKSVNVFEENFIKILIKVIALIY